MPAAVRAIRTLTVGLLGAASASSTVAGVFFLALLSAPRPAMAQPEDTAAAASSQEQPPPQVVPPLPVSTRVTYPPGGEGNASVLLEFVVRVDGSVEKISVLRGKEPFRTAALEAARTWRFEPATQDGTAVAARIRFEVRFAEEQVSGFRAGDEEPAEPDEPAPGTPKAGKQFEGQIEVVVRGERRHPEVVTVSRAEARQIPGTFGDLMRAVEVLPGVTPVMSGAPWLFIRGAPPGNVGYFIDGVRVPQLYHIFVGPSVIHPSMLDRVELYRGGYPARYGRYSGAVVAAYTSEPHRRLRGEGVVRVFDAGALMEAPFDEGRGSAIVAGRYSYTALIVSLLTETDLEYWDYQSLVSYELGKRDTLSVFAFGSFDQIFDEQVEQLTGTEFHRIDLRWDSQPSRRTDVRWALTLGTDETVNEYGFVRDRSLGVRSEVKHRMQAATLYAGADTVLDRYQLQVERSTLSYSVLQALLSSRDDLTMGAYSDLAIEPEPWFTVTPGLRVDLFSSGGRSAVGVDPRISVSFREACVAPLFPQFLPGRMAT